MFSHSTASTHGCPPSTKCTKNSTQGAAASTPPRNHPRPGGRSQVMHSTSSQSVHVPHVHATAETQDTNSIPQPRHTVPPPHTPQLCSFGRSAHPDTARAAPARAAPARRSRRLQAKSCPHTTGGRSTHLAPYCTRRTCTLRLMSPSAGRMSVTTTTRSPGLTMPR